MNKISFEEPQRLKVVWQSPDSRRNYHVADLVRSGSGAELHYNTNSEDLKEAENFGFSGLNAFPVDTDIYQNQVMEILSRRLPPRGRDDYNEFLANWAIPSDMDISNFALLGFSQGRLPGDSISFYPCFEEFTLPFSFLVEIAGFRHHEGMGVDVRSLKNISFVHDTENSVDENAVQIRADGICLGYVNRALTDSFHTWFMKNYSITAEVFRVNGTQERPRVHLLVKIDI